MASPLDSSHGDVGAGTSAADLADERDTASIHAALAQTDAKAVTIDLPALLKNRDKLKKACRAGIPFKQRREVWRALFDVNTQKASGVNYVSAKLEVFNDIMHPTHFPHIPDFGSTMKWNENYIHLTTKRINHAKAILCVLACSHATLTHCPFLPDLTCVLLIFFHEAATYEILERMIMRSKQDEFYFTTNPSAFLKWMKTFDILLEQKNGDLHAHMHRTLKLDPGKVFQVWLSRFFIQYVSMRTVFRILDAFLLEGNKILFRITLAILKLHTKELLACTTSHAFLVKLHACMIRQDANELLEAGFDMYLSRGSHIGKIGDHLIENKTKLLQNAPNARRAHFHLPRFHEKHDHISELVTVEELYSLWSWLPPHAAICDPVLIYSASIHGYSYDTLWRRACEKAVGELSPIFMLLRDATSDQVVGLFLNRPLPDHPDLRNKASRAAHRVGGLTGADASTSPMPLDPLAFLFVLRPYAAAYKHRTIKEDEAARAVENAQKQDLVPGQRLEEVWDDESEPASAASLASPPTSPKLRYIVETSEEARSFKPYGIPALQTDTDHEVMPRKPAGLTITVQAPSTSDRTKAQLFNGSVGGPSKGQHLGVQQASVHAATPGVGPVAHNLMPQSNDPALSSVSLGVGPSQPTASQPLSELFGNLEVSPPPPANAHGTTVAAGASPSLHAASLKHALALANSPQPEQMVPAGQMPQAILLPPSALPNIPSPPTVPSASAASSVASSSDDSNDRPSEAMLLMTDSGFGIVEPSGAVLFLSADLKSAITGPSTIFESPSFTPNGPATSRGKFTVSSIEVWSFVSPGSEVALEAKSPRAQQKALAKQTKAREAEDDAQFKSQQAAAAAAKAKGGR